LCVLDATPAESGSEVIEERKDSASSAWLRVTTGFCRHL